MDQALHPLTRPGARSSPQRGGRAARWPLIAVGGVVILPIAVGLWWTLLPAFGHLPAVAGSGVASSPWREVFAYPGLWTAAWLSAFTGVAATVLSLALSIGFCAVVHGRLGFRRAEAMLAPILASPHAAIAIGFAFVIAPSGWIARLVSPWLTGWSTPPDLATVGDPLGLALIVALMIKEVPFLLLMILAALNQVPVDAHMKAARSLGYGRGIAWIKVILPQIYPQIRLPILAVLVFSLSVVDMALILGPDNPPTLAVLALRWLLAPDVTSYLPGAAAAVLLLAIGLFAIGLWLVAERIAAHVGRFWISRGGRGVASEPGLRLAGAGVALVFAFAALSMLATGLWSFATAWRYPGALPVDWTLATWSAQLPMLGRPAWMTLSLGLVTTLVGLLMVIGWLENEGSNSDRMKRASLRLMYIPLLVPQIAFLFGVQVLLVRLGIDGSFFAVAWTHLIFVVPYLFLSLADPWRALDPRYARSAAALGASPGRILLTVKLPMLLRPLLTAAAVGFSASVAQYLPTLFAGGGRIPTLTTEAVALASGADRRVVGVYAFAQSFMPLLVYVAALLLPLYLFRNRRAL
ncbi:ABC transporter permease [Bauldia litoralis]|uniref:Putative thiamine transport system permease protein n=1 Tax=Bauldia litoralis TaxID=665467 RepID=A0A1G6DYZ9_9HYPH|nr:ABC transporter permease subunit [Bauldia litoralis]SDB50384.1 putative thiamine transport system permease protein [Bauldia litoralis]